MKAILVIDVPVEDSMDFGHMDIRADVIVKAYNDLDFKTYVLEHIKVEPIPDKLDWRIGYVKDKNTCEIFNKNYVDGYNKCIDEILREEE